MLSSIAAGRVSTAAKSSHILSYHSISITATSHDNGDRSNRYTPRFARDMGVSLATKRTAHCYSGISLLFFIRCCPADHLNNGRTSDVVRHVLHVLKLPHRETIPFLSLLLTVRKFRRPEKPRDTPYISKCSVLCTQ